MPVKKTGCILFAALLTASCQFFGDLVSPDEQTLVDFSGTVISAKTNLPVPGVRVELMDRADSTDDNGYFLFSNIETGENQLKMLKQEFIPKTLKIKITLSEEGRQYVLRPASSMPRILSFSCNPETTYALESRVSFIFSAEDDDTSDYPLLGKLVFGPSDTEAVSYSGKGQTRILSHVFTSPGLYDVQLYLWDWERQPVTFDSAIHVFVDSNHTPLITAMVQDTPFTIDTITDSCTGRIRITLQDLDSNWKALWINWDDLSSMLVINDLPARPLIDTVFSHCYGEAGSHTIEASVADNRNATSKRNLTVVVVVKP